MRSPFTALLLVLACALPALAQEAPRSKRLALVIGNAAYKDAPLPNPVNDADDMERALAASGFTVIKRTNATLREMHLALREFGDRLDRQGTGVFYFAGHWYSGAVKRYVVAEESNVTVAGRQLQNQRWELESYRVK